MKYKTLIKRFEKYAEQEVDIVVSKGEVVFFPVGHGWNLITTTRNITIKRYWMNTTDCIRLRKGNLSRANKEFTMENKTDGLELWMFGDIKQIRRLRRLMPGLDDKPLNKQNYVHKSKENNLSCDSTKISDRGGETGKDHAVSAAEKGGILHQYSLQSPAEQSGSPSG